MQENSFNEERDKVNHLLQTYFTHWHFSFHVNCEAQYYLLFHLYILMIK